MTDHDHDGYRGPATLTVRGRELAVQALLDARHEPLDGRMHWFGRLTGDDLADALGSRTADAVLTTPLGRSSARVGDVDAWGRYRVSGVGTPPFGVPAVHLDD
ncbi:DUF4873 domain-containing protein [Pseudonocardia benzenivorans]|jgi:hypothetical protein|uniref:Flavin binding monooxygenase n=2 Tax=Pseudonocardia TaxID=1847 RepID=F4CP59_PSEUX|nr:DUF4873 domain-containing protein [Pseudonocardia dioxanivorans]AEA23325.1 flavin binding monooxygenase [Pseudonocardia dioxanivorans CB1190]GJF03655.1 DUF4873 domain-containing protein [Pseudonocardia sp. D17]